MPYGSIEGEARERAEKELDREFAEIADSALLCVTCTHTRQKALKGESIQYAKKDWRIAMCKKHRQMRTVAYNTSPLSENYWSS